MNDQKPPRNVTPLGALLLAALEAKSRELGETYSARDLGRDSGVNHSYATKVIYGKPRISEQIIRSWAAALHPYFPLDNALILAGYLPASPSWRQRIIAEAKAIFAGHRSVADALDRTVHPDPDPPTGDGEPHQ